jgi:hypothetical protein
VPRELQRLEQGRDVRTEKLVAAGGQEGRERGERVRGDGEHQRLRGGGQEGVWRRRRLVRPPRRGGRRGEVERERGGGRRRWRDREERAPISRCVEYAAEGAGSEEEQALQPSRGRAVAYWGGAGVSSDTSRGETGWGEGFRPWAISEGVHRERAEVAKLAERLRSWEWSSCVRRRRGGGGC